MSSETAREKAFRLMPNAVKEYIDGVMYFQWASPYKPSVMYEKLKELQFRNDDILSIGWPRSGNHWTYYILDMILKQKPTPTTTGFVEVYSDVRSDEERAEWCAQPSPRCFFSHVKMERIPHVLKSKPKIIYILRNPKDAMVSFYRLMKDFSDEFRFYGTWDEFFDVQLVGEMVWGTWADHVLAMDRFIKDNPDIPVYIHQFEEVKEKPVECIRNLCAFLEVPDDLADGIASATGLESLKSAVEKQGAANSRFFEPGKASFIQKGMVGNWKNTFTIEQNERFDKDFEEKMAGCQLADRVRKYIV